MLSLLEHQSHSMFLQCRLIADIQRLEAGPLATLNARNLCPALMNVRFGPIASRRQGHKCRLFR